MSLIIVVISKDNKLYLVSDKRITKDNGDYFDILEKVTELIKNKLYIGFTGDVGKYSGNNFNFDIINKIIDDINTTKSIEDIINDIKNNFIFYSNNKKNFGIILAGRYENNDTFFFCQSISSNEYILKRYNDTQIDCNLLLGDNSIFFKTYLNKELSLNSNIELCIKNTIKYASEVTKSISEICDFIVL